MGIFCSLDTFHDSLYPFRQITSSTRKYSSRMHTSRFETIHVAGSVDTTRCCSLTGALNRSLATTTHMSLAKGGGCGSWSGWVGGWVDVFGDGGLRG